MDSQINAVIENLCTQFNVTVEYLVPKIQAYKMAMCMFGFITAAIFVVIIGIVCGWFILKFSENDDLECLVGTWCVTVLAEVIPTIVMFGNIYDYIGWKYASEAKLIEYIVELVRK